MEDPQSSARHQTRANAVAHMGNYNRETDRPEAAVKPKIEPPDNGKDNNPED